MPHTGINSRKTGNGTTGTNYADSWARHECPPLPHIEYNIYSYSNDDNPRACWQKCGSAGEARSAVVHAETLFNSGAFSKIEVKQRYFDTKTRRNIDETWRIFEHEQLKPRSIWLPVAAFAVATILLVLSYTMAITG